MIKSDLIKALAKKQPHLERKDVALAVACMLEQISEALMTNDRIEIRGFGSFSLHYRPPCTGRNPKSGAELNLPAGYFPYFKPSKALRQRIDLLRTTCQIKRKA